MTMKKLVIWAVMAIVVWSVTLAMAGEWKTPEDFEKAQREAEEALHRTGANAPLVVDLKHESAIPINYDSVDISGGTDTTVLKNGKKLDKNAGEIDMNVVSLDRVMSELGAKTTDTAIIINLKNDVLFDFDKSNIKPEARATLAKVALIIKKKARGKILIEGHTDSKGSEEYNQRLSERRAEAVKRWLVERHGLKPDRFMVRGWGETRPVAPNTNKDGSDNPAGRALNRRVVITIPVK